MRKHKEKDVEKLIAEEAKRMLQISEYSFYTGKDSDDERDLLLGEDDEENPEDINNDQPTDDAKGDLGAEVDNVENELGLNDNPEPDNTEMELPDTNTQQPEQPQELPAEPVEDEVEIDITDLVKKTEEAKGSADEANAKMLELLGRFNQLQTKISTMDKITQKIDSLEHEIEKRNPTPEEKIEMRSLDSYPYNIKLSDFWSEHEDNVAKPAEYINGKKKEFVLTKDEVNNYNSPEIKKSFTEYEEEDI